MKISMRNESSRSNLYISTKGFRGLNIYYIALAAYNLIMLYFT